MENKAKDRQPMNREGGSKPGDSEGPGSRQGWQPDRLADQASQKDVDEIQRETLRGDETEGDANDRDIAGRVDSN
jgi:hypothetical protein